MKNAIILTFAIISFCSCNKNANRYYISKDPKLFSIFGSNYILGEIKDDSIQIWYVSEDINYGYYQPYETEVLPLRPSNGRNFSIKTINPNFIIGKKNNLHAVKDLKNYFRLRNELTAIMIDSQFSDSIKQILGINYTGINFMDPRRRSEKTNKLILNEHCDSFPKSYRAILESEMNEVRVERNEHFSFYQKLTKGLIEIDSLMFDEFARDYNNSKYDQQSFRYIILKKPEVFFLHVNLISIGWDVRDCKGCFTKEELQEMYCFLKPLMQKNPNQLWMFESRGDLKCKD